MAKKKESLSSKQKEFADLYLTSKEPAYATYLEVYDCTEKSARAAAYRLLGNVRLKEYIHAKTRGRILRGSFLGVEKLIELVDSDDENVALRSSKELAYMGGHKPKEQLEHSGRVESGVSFHFGDTLTEDDL